MPDQVADAKGLSGRRYVYIDMWRGIAIVLMILFHFSYDLNHFQYIDADFDRDPFWLNFRILIVTLFLLLVGISLQLASGHGLNMRRYLRRLALLTGAAVLVSMGNYLVMSSRPILFGVLHFIALASVLGLLFRRLYWTNLLLGIGIVVFGIRYNTGLFDSSLWYWTGLMKERPITSDYVPLIPWFGVVLVGMFLARVIEKYELLSIATQEGNMVTRLLVLGGRNSLLIYLLHQPIFFGGFYLISFIIQPG